MSKPLTRLLKKEADVKRDWDEAADQAVADIKEAFSHSLVMAQFDPTKDLLVQTDASNFALGAVLCHVEGEGADRKEYPIMFASKTLNKQQMNYSVTEKECLAVEWALDQFRSMLIGKPFQLETDHSALRQLLTTKDPSGRIARWVIKLQEYDMEVFHRKGRIHRNADYLSRDAAMDADGNLLIKTLQIASISEGKKVDPAVMTRLWDEVCWEDIREQSGSKKLEVGSKRL